MIVLTGASGALGSHIATLLTQSGKRVVGLSRTKGTASIEYIAVDLRDETSIDKAADTINKDPDRIEALIHCAGVLSVEEAHNLTAGDIDKVLDINIRAPLLLTSRLFQKIKKDGADVVNVSSTVGYKGYAQQAVYGASKWAMRGFSANLQTELAGTSCRVISFCPGGFKSKFFAKATGVDNTKDSTEWMDAIEIAKVLVFTLTLPKNMEVSEIVINRKK